MSSIRLKDIASRLGLSVSTVSAALQDRKDISSATRELVRAAVRELGYHPNSLARSLVMRRSQVIGVIVPDLSRSFFADVLKGVDEIMNPAAYNLLVCNSEENAEREEQALGMLMARQVDGILLATAHNGGDPAWQQTLARVPVPLVLVDRRIPGHHFVGGNDEKIGAEATLHLAGQGYGRIAHICGPQTVATAVGRLEGYRRALSELSLPFVIERVVESNYHAESGGYEAMQKLLALDAGVRPDAVFAASDPIAIGVLQAALDARLEIPRDFGLIGVGNHQYSQYLRVPLSTVDQQRLQIGREAAKLLLRLVDDEAQKSKRKAGPEDSPGAAAAIDILLEPQLVARASSLRGEAVLANSGGRRLKD